jgi:REP element-mobilizing transposase RayT
MNRGDGKRHHRRSIRLRGYDYTQAGAYFVTICTRNREPLFGQVVDGKLELNDCGEIVKEEWFRTAEVRPNVELFEEEFVVMPNHIHGIIWIVVEPVGATRRVAPTDGHPHGPMPDSLGAMIGLFKSNVTKRINAHCGTPGARVWQRNYYEHIIRTDRAMNAIRRYIAENPLRWHLDRYNPDATGPDFQARDLWQMLQEDSRTHPHHKPDVRQEDQP